jgi:hypothetical protein
MLWTDKAGSIEEERRLSGMAHQCKPWNVRLLLQSIVAEDVAILI